MWATLKQKKFWQGEMWNKRKNGKIYAEWLSISAVTSPDGCVDHYVGTFSEITQNKEAEAEIHRLAYYDPLTQLPNRRLLYDRLGQALASSKRHGRHGAILFMDLDNFKTLNDTHGHDVGDLLLTEAALRLIGAVREGDTIARLGGDEFVLLLEDLSENVEEAAIQVSLVGEKVLAAIASPYVLKGIEYICTISIGISLFYNHCESVDDLLKHADLAMYHAKKGGRNGLRFFDPAMQAALVERSALESDLRYALERQQLRLYYQIQVNSASHVIGAEALLRWEHPQRGLVAPDQFIPLAEETGLILPIGLWVVQMACAQIKAWSGSAVTSDLQIAVNISPRQFRQPDFVKQVQQAISDTGINPARLKIELTESLALDNMGDTVTKMNALIAQGIGLAMDDFGTGYSSLTHLKQLPLDQLKIDQSFIRDLAIDPNDAAIVQAIITMGRSFGLNVIAEGVETEAQRELLDKYGCRAFQGYLFGRPLPVTEFEKLLLQYA
jgi:diguanylate cyclase (GGDEF)-like protein